MNYCKNCNLKIIDNEDICPLCKSILVKSIDKNKKTTNIENEYPNIIPKIQQLNFVIRILVIISIVISILSVVINYFTYNGLPWSIICLAGIVYIWISYISAIKNNVNIAYKILIETFCAQILLYIIDRVVGYKGWSLNYGLPIIVCLSNIAMFVLFIIKHVEYKFYVWYEVILFILSMIPVIIYNLHYSTFVIPTIVSTVVALSVLACSIIFYSKEIKNEFLKRFHF